ncbi:MAG: methionyl-tRNA formyltransferase [Bacteroidota bacterium]|jgi:methionyl-tRNA formyltransferase
MKIVFFGTPGFAVGVLSKIIEEKYTVVAVVTAPDKPAGRGKKLLSSEVKEYALSKNLMVLQPEKLKSEEFITQLHSLNADVFVVVAFRMLPQIVWKMPSKGTFNLHASLLPQYRGAAPINWAIINGEKETGVTTFFIQEEIDKGNIIFQEKIKIEDNWDAGILHDKLMDIGSALVVKTLGAIENNTINTVSQEDVNLGMELKLAPKIFKEDCKLNFSDLAEKIHLMCKGLSPFPGAWCTLKNNEKTFLLKIYETSILNDEFGQTKPGTTQSDNKTFIRFKSGDKWLSLLSLQLEGKKRMRVDEFLRGFNWESDIQLVG